MRAIGFSVTATHAILLVALLSAGGAASAAFWHVQEAVDEAQRASAKLEESRVHTNLTVSASAYDAVADTYTLDVLNAGSTTLRVSEVHVLVDGALATNVDSTAVNGDASTDLWLPGETLVIRLGSIATTPTYAHVIAGNGASASHQE